MHTPGPWHAGGVFDPNGFDPTQWIWSKTQEGDQSGVVIANGVRMRDVSLLASAPELLEALTWCVANSGECLGDHPKRIAAYAMLLIKATGE